MPDPKHPRSERPFKSVAEAEKYKFALLRELEDGYLPKELTLGEVLRTWFDKKFSTGKAGTKYSYNSIINCIEKDSVYSMAVSSLKHYHIEDYMDKLKSDGKSPNTCRKYLVVIKSALEFAHSREMIARNPAAAVDTISIEDKKIDPPSTESVVKLLNHLVMRCKENPEHYENRLLYVFDHVDSVTGLRHNELRAITWNDVNLTEGFIDINKTCVELPGELIQHSTKNNKDRRVYLSEVDIRILKDFKGFCKALFFKQGLHLQDEHFVFAQSFRGKADPTLPISGQRIRRMHYKALDEIGEPHWRIHDNRHAIGSMMVENGTDLKVVQELLGHDSLSTTANIYVHITKNTLQKESEKITGIFYEAGYRA